MSKLAKLTLLHSRATKGEWVKFSGVESVIYDNSRNAVGFAYSTPDMEYIIAAHNLMPYLLESAAVLTETLSFLEDVRAGITDAGDDNVDAHIDSIRFALEKLK